MNTPRFRRSRSYSASSRAVATPAERGEDCRPDPADVEEPPELDRADHDPVPEIVERDGVPYHVDRCRKCGAYAPRSDGVCRGRNRALDEFGE